MRRQRRIGRSTRIPQDAEPSLPPRLRTLRRRARSTASGEPGGTIRRRSRSTGSRACRCLRRCTLAPPEPVEPRAGALLTGFGLSRTRLASLERMHRGVAERHPLLVLQTGNVVVRQRVRHDALLWSRSTSGLTTRRRRWPSSSIQDASIDLTPGSCLRARITRSRDVCRSQDLKHRVLRADDVRTSEFRGPCRSCPCRAPSEAVGGGRQSAPHASSLLQLSPPYFAFSAAMSAGS